MIYQTDRKKLTNDIISFAFIFRSNGMKNDCTGFLLNFKHSEHWIDYGSSFCWCKEDPSSLLWNQHRTYSSWTRFKKSSCCQVHSFLSLTSFCFRFEDVCLYPVCSEYRWMCSAFVVSETVEQSLPKKDDDPKICDESILEDNILFSKIWKNMTLWERQ